MKEPFSNSVFYGGCIGDQ